MRKLTFTLLLAVVFGFQAFAQDAETYTVLKVAGGNTPVIDGTIDAIWKSVQIIPVTKVPEIGGEVHPNITEPHPAASDYSAFWGALWNTEGIFFYYKVVDDKLTIVDDYYTDNEIAADMWWTDDNINILFSKDLVNNSFQQWEFAWQPGVDQEEKLTSDLWANPALIPGSSAKSKWFHDGTTWILETFIYWDAFADGNATITPGMKIYFEVRARDDDDDGTWETMYQWSTINYNVESDGLGMGEVTLSATEVQPSNVGVSYKNQSGKMALYPNTSDGLTQLQLNLAKQGNVAVTVYDMTGKMINEMRFNDKPAGQNLIPLNLSMLRQGMYVLNVSSDNGSGLLKYIRQ
jgi:hypothetical protein